MPERRLHRRWSRRARVQFWRRDEPDSVLRGYTSDLSKSGAFVTTEKPVGRNGRIQMRIDTGRGHYLLEGVVARSVLVHKELARVKPGGMGVRFLRVDELVAELLKTAAADLQSSAPGTPELSAHQIETAEASSRTEAEGTFEVDLSSVERFLRVWDQDISVGGLFVETDTPAEAESTVQLLIRTPAAEEPFEALASVVQVFEPG
ncbi:MAG: PilZ domain-containing protein, partial [Acidobacteriota bacterium]